MILFLRVPSKGMIAAKNNYELNANDNNKLCWLFGEAVSESEENLQGCFVGPRRKMITPWSTSTVEIIQNMRLGGISRIKEYFPVKDESVDHDPMLQRVYKDLDQNISTTNRQPETIIYIDDLEVYNEREGLALSKEEMDYLKKVESDLGRRLTDSEVFRLAQISSEHCRHKILGGTFTVDGVEQKSSLFQMAKKTAQENPNKTISAYKGNVAFTEGPVTEQSIPVDRSKPNFFRIRNIKSVILLKVETHNFPTIVGPFDGASTGTGGEIRGRMDGGKDSRPIVGTAVYTAFYPCTEEGREWEEILPVRKRLYQTPRQVLIRASSGVSDFGNKSSQSLTRGSVLTFGHTENNETYGYGKVIMLVGDVGYDTRRDYLKGQLEAGNEAVMIGGDNYRIGLGGSSVPSADTDRYSNGIELNAVQRINAEIQKRANNVVRTLCEGDESPVVSIHDHGSVGYVNCLSEPVEECGGLTDMSKLSIGDRTSSAKGIIANESQERMRLLIEEEAIEHICQTAERERAPMYVVGETTGDHRFALQQADGVRLFDLAVDQTFGSSPKTYTIDKIAERHYAMPEYEASKLRKYLTRVLQLGAVACKNWLTSKMDRSATGKVARQQCRGGVQLPLSDCGVVALDYHGEKGIVTSTGHAPRTALADPAAGSILSVSEALTNLVRAPLAEGLDSTSLPANWVWLCRSQEGEDARLCTAVKAPNGFYCTLQIDVPTGKDPLSMAQKYPSEEKVVSPGVVIVSADGEVSDVEEVIFLILVSNVKTTFYRINFSFDSLKLGDSAFAQSLGRVGGEVPCVQDVEYLHDALLVVQGLVNKGLILAEYNISAGGLIATLLEVCFTSVEGGLEIELDKMEETDIVKVLFVENPGIATQINDRHEDEVKKILEDAGAGFTKSGKPADERHTLINKDGAAYQFDIDYMRDVWYSSSYLLDRKQSVNGCTGKHLESYKMQPLEFAFVPGFKGKLSQYGITPERHTPSGIHVVIIREKDTNGEYEVVYSLCLAGFDVKDVTMTDLISGRETLENVNMIIYHGGFSNSDASGSTKGWVGGFLLNPGAREAFDKLYTREDTLSSDICNGCQSIMELGLVNPEHEKKRKMLHDESHKLESASIGATIPASRSVMFGSLSDSELGIWVARGEGEFSLPYDENQYNVVARYSYDEYPGNPNGSGYSIAAPASTDGRHLAMMPRLERTILPWQNANYPTDRVHSDQATPWIKAFVNARRWIEEKTK